MSILWFWNNRNTKDFIKGKLKGIKKTFLSQDTKSNKGSGEKYQDEKFHNSIKLPLK